MSRDYYKVLLVSQSGKGKTYSARNLDKETTGFINVENKPLPFRGNFKYHTRCTTYQEAWNALIEYAKNPDIKVIFFDSLSAYVDLVLFEARKTKKNFEIWNLYNDEIGKVLNMIKRVPKEVYVTAHYEILTPEGDPEKRVKVKGKEWEGVVEKEFTVVLYADRKLNEKKETEAWFNGALEGSSAKCPPDLIKAGYKFDNDCAYIQECIEEYVK
jgi:hypothetical protein